MNNIKINDRVTIFKGKNNNFKKMDDRYLFKVTKINKDGTVDIENNFCKMSNCSRSRLILY